MIGVYMDYKIEWNFNNSCLKIILVGEFEIKNLEKCHKEILDHENWYPGTDILWDVRDCSRAGISAADVKAIALMTNRYKN